MNKKLFSDLRWKQECGAVLVDEKTEFTKEDKITQKELDKECEKLLKELKKQKTKKTNAQK